MFNLNAVVRAFNLTTVDVGLVQDPSTGWTYTYRPNFCSLSKEYGTKVASASFVDAQDLFEIMLSLRDITVTPVVAVSMVNFVNRLEKVKDEYKDYTLVDLLDFVYKFEDRHSSNTLDEVRFYAEIREDLYEEFSRLGMDTATLAALYGIAERSLHYRKDYNS